MNTYTFGQISLLVAFHALGLCWGIVFPFHYKRVKAEGRIKYIHVTTVVLTLVLPAIPALLHLIDGYSISLGPQAVCTGQNIAITYFITILPMSILMAMATSVLVILFWRILKVRYTGSMTLFALNHCCTCFAP